MLRKYRIVLPDIIRTWDDTAGTEQQCNKCQGSSLPETASRLVFTLSRVLFQRGWIWH